MTNQKQSYIVTAFAPEEIDQQFIKAKRQFELFINQPLTHKKGIITKNHAHITLYRSFFLRDGVNEQHLFNLLADLKVPEINIRSETVEIFQTLNHGNVVVALVEKTPELLSFEEDLTHRLDQVTGELSSEPVYEFKPHLSVFYKVPDEKLSETYTYVKENIIPLRFRLESVELLKSLPGIVGERVKIKDY